MSFHDRRADRTHHTRMSLGFDLYTRTHRDWLASQLQLPTDEQVRDLAARVWNSFDPVTREMWDDRARSVWQTVANVEWQEPGLPTGNGDTSNESGQGHGSQLDVAELDEQARPKP